MCFQKKKSSAKTTADVSFLTIAHQGSMKHPKNDQILVDCGATCHLLNSSEHFTVFGKSFDPHNHFIELPDGRRSNKRTIAREDARFTILDSKGTPRDITLKDALLTPGFPTSLFSVGAPTDAGAKVTFDKGGACLAYGSTTFDFLRCGNLYFLPNNGTKVSTACTLQEWHISLGHMSYNDIMKLQSVTTGIQIAQGKQNMPTCLTCTENKMKKCPKTHDIPQKYAEKHHDRVHTDICVPILPTSREGFNYIVNFIDEYSSMLFVYFLHSTDEAHIAVKQFICRHGATWSYHRGTQ